LDMHSPNTARNSYASLNALHGPQLTLLNFKFFLNINYESAPA